MHSKSNCRECKFPIKPYKQIEQTDSDLCEFCAIAYKGLTEFPDSHYPPGVTSSDIDLEDLML